MLGKEAWIEIYENSDLNGKFDRFHDILQYYYNICFPLKIGKQTANKKLWVTTEVKSSSSNLKHLFSLKSLFPNLENVYKKSKKEQWQK